MEGAGAACPGREQWGDLSPLSSSGSSGSPGDFSGLAFPSQIPRPCPVWGVNQRLLRESQGRAHGTFCTAITKMTRKQSPGLQDGERLDTVQNKLFLPRYIRPLQPLLSASLLSFLGGVAPSDVAAVPSGSQSGAGRGLAQEVREPRSGSRASTDLPSGLCFLPSHVSFSLQEHALQGE